MSALLNSIIDNIVNPFIYLLLILAFLYFFWGMLKFISNADNDEARSTGKKHMVWGIVGIVIMVSAYSILRMVAATFGVDADL